jgi:EmrB/QacA subfamily drug resistance transporter
MVTISTTGSAAEGITASSPGGSGSEASQQNPHHSRRWSILLILALAQLMVVLDSTVVNIALPSAQKALGFDDTQRQWIVTAYALAFGSLLLLGGRLSDMVGRKRMFIVGLVGFAVASAVGGAATGFGMLVAARAVQGAFGAMLAPAALSLLTTTFTDPRERPKAFSIYGSVAGGGGAVGLLLGGALTEYLSWRWCMYVNLVFAFAALVGAAVLLQHQRSAEKVRLDVPGLVMVVGGLFSLVYGFSQAETAGWTDAGTLALLIGGVVLLAAFTWWQARSSHPLLPLRILTNRNRGGSLLAILLTSGGMFGLFLFLTYYLQAGLGFSAVQTGLAFLPMVGALAGTALLSSSLLSRRVGPAWIVASGMLVAAVGMVLLTRIGVDTGYVGHVLPGLLVSGAGIGLVFSSAQSLATLGLQSQDAGVGSAMTTVGQQIGGSIGTALLNTIFASALSGYLIAHAPASPQVQAAGSIHGYKVVFWVSAAIFATGAVLVGWLLPGKVQLPDPDAEEVISL